MRKRLSSGKERDKKYFERILIFWMKRIEFGKKSKLAQLFFSQMRFNFDATKYKKNFHSDSLNAGSAISGADEVP